MSYSQSPRAHNRERGLNITLFFLLLASLFAYTNSSRPEIYPDSNTYLAFAEQIRTGNLFETKPLWAIPSETLTRTPGFPVILALWQTLFGTQIANLPFLHFTIGVITLFSVPYLLRYTIPPWMVLSLLAGLFICSGHAYYAPVLTEWTALNLLLILCSMSVRFLQTPRVTLLLVIELLAAFAVLIRPALLPILLLPTAFTLCIPHRSQRILLTALIVPFVPTFSWAAFNYMRADTPTLASLAGINLFGATSLIGSAETIAHDPLLFREFIESVNRDKEPKNSTMLPIAAFFERDFPLLYFHDRNIWQIGLRAYKKLSLTQWSQASGKHMEQTP